MTSNINTSGINAAFPYAGQDNPSNGFRTNWTQISNNLNIAHDEITALQNQVGAVSSNLTLTLAGDVVAPTTVLPGGATMTTTLKSRGIGNQSYDSTKQDVNFEVNDSGIITGFSITNASSTGSTSYPISITTVSTSNGSSISELVLPEFSVSPNGKIVSSDNKTLNFGLFGYNLKQGSVIVGNSNNQSDMISPSASKQVLMFDGTNTNFQTLSITDFEDVDFSGAQTGQVLTFNGTKWVPETVQSEGGFNPNSITTKTSVPSDASFIISEKDSNGNVTLESVDNSDMVSYLTSSIKFKLVDDTSPQLGGTLDLNGNGITASSDASIIIGGSLTLQTGGDCNISVGTGTMMTLSSSSVSIASNLFSIVSGSSNIVLNQTTGLTLRSNTSIIGSLTVNNVTYPTALPSSSGMFLSCDNTGKTSWAAPSLSSAFSGMNTASSGNKNSEIMIYDPTSSTPSLIPASSLLVPFNYNKYYVSQNGNDSTGDGSITAPYQTISGVMNYFSSNSSTTYTDIEIIFDTGSYDISSVTVPTNITNLYFNTINGKSSEVTITCSNGNFIIQNTGFYASDIEFSGSGIITSDVRFYNCKISGGGTITFQSSNNSSFIFDNCELNMNNGSVVIHGYSSVNVTNVNDLTKASTLSFGSTSGSETCNYILSGSNIGIFNVYSGNLYVNSCEFYKSFTSNLGSSNVLSINNCNFVDYPVVGGSSCSVNYSTSAIGFYNNNNRSFASQSKKSVSVKTLSNSYYGLTQSINYTDTIIDLNADVVVLEITQAAIIASGGQIKLHISSTPVTFMCTLVIFNDFTSVPTSNDSINLKNITVLNNYTSDQSFSLPGLSSGEPDVTIDLAKMMYNTSSGTHNGQVYKILCNPLTFNNNNSIEPISGGGTDYTINGTLVTGSHYIIANGNNNNTTL